MRPKTKRMIVMIVPLTASVVLLTLAAHLQWTNNQTDTSITQTFVAFVAPSPIPVNTLSPQGNATAQAILLTPIMTPPRFILGFEPPSNNSLSIPKNVAITFWEAGLWEPGDSWDTVQDRVLYQTTLTINGKTIAYKPNALITWSLEGYPIPSSGTTIADWGNEDRLAWPVQFQPGLYVATVETASRNGPPHTFTWAFQIP